MSRSGVIFISIDENEAANLKVICDEIFGSACFVADIAVVNNFKGRSDAKYVATAHEHLIMYRGPDFITKGVTVPDEYIKEYKLSDEHGRYRLLGLRKRGANSRREDRPNLFYGFAYNPAINRLRIGEPDLGSDEVAIFPRLSDGSDGNWRWGKETAQKRIDELEVKLVKRRNEYDIFQKDYLDGDAEKRVKPKSVWQGSEFSAEAGTLELKQIMGKGSFETPKPTTLIQYCLEQISKQDCLILDSFAGSGTTAHAVLNSNRDDETQRRFILIELSDYADSITAERVKRVIRGYERDSKPVPGTGGSFSYYELGESLFVDGNLNPVVPVKRVREYVWFTETGTPYESASVDGYPYFLGVHNDTSYVFIFEPDRPTVLDRLALSQIPGECGAGSYVVYADTCVLSDDELRTLDITFKKIPRDITRL